MGKKSFIFMSFVVLIFASAILIQFWSYIFARTVVGHVERVEKISSPVAMLGDTSTALSREIMFSFAVAIKEDSGEIVTASTEDRQWAVVDAGKCAEAKYYPYPPWNLGKAGTYFNARLIKLEDCSNKVLSTPGFRLSFDIVDVLNYFRNVFK